MDSAKKSGHPLLMEKAGQYSCVEFYCTMIMMHGAHSGEGGQDLKLKAVDIRTFLKLKLYND